MMSRLCELLYELLLHIISFASREDLPQVCLISHQFRDLAQPELYRSFNENRGNCARLRAFTLTLVRRPDLAAHCKDLDLSHWSQYWCADGIHGLMERGLRELPTGPKDVLTQAAIDTGLVDGMFAHSMDEDRRRMGHLIDRTAEDTFGELWREGGPTGFAVYANLLLVLCVNVEIITFDPDWSDPDILFWGSGRSNSPSILRCGALQKLQSLEFEGRLLPYNLETLLLDSCLYIPSLRTLACANGLNIRLDSMSEAIPLRLISIEIGYCMIAADDLEKLLNVCEALESFIYQYRSYRCHGTKHVMYGVIAALEKHQSCLKHLNVGHLGDFERCEQYPGKFARYSSCTAFLLFTAITSLQIEYATLLNVDGNMHRIFPSNPEFHPDATRTFLSRLPPNIEQLTIRMATPNVCLYLEELAQQLPDLHPHPKRIDVELQNTISQDWWHKLRAAFAANGVEVCFEYWDRQNYQGGAVSDDSDDGTASLSGSTDEERSDHEDVYTPDWAVNFANWHTELPAGFLCIDLEIIATLVRKDFR